MTPATMSLLLLGGSLAVGGCGLAVYFAFSAESEHAGRLLGSYEAWLDRRASFILLPYRGFQVARYQLVAAGVGVALWATTRSPVFALFVLLVAALPPVVLWKQRETRITKLERQLDTWLLMLANALKATSSVGEAIASTVALVPRPFSEEIDLLVKEIRLGVPLDRALKVVAQRINSSVISGALAMIVVARQTGGDLSLTLEQAASALRESARLEGVLRTKTAEGRGQVLVLASAPFILCVIIAWLDGAWFDPMLSHHYGRSILAACSLVWTFASFWAYQIVQADL